MAANNSHFYLEVTYAQDTQFSFCLLLTEQGQWKLINASSPGVFGKDPNWQRGTFRTSPACADDFKDFMTGDGNTVAFRMGDIRFPPSISSERGFMVNVFSLGELWANQLGAKLAKCKGTWAPIATGALVTEVKQRAEAMQKEFREVCKLLGLDVAALIDPTGLMNFPAAVQASTMGDYLGCTLNLLALIPGIGKVANAAKNARALDRIHFLSTELKFLERWLNLSVKSLKRGNGANTGLEVTIQGTTRASKTVRAAETAVSAVQPLKNNGWLSVVSKDIAKQMGLLPEELAAFRRIADEGYYFVVRSCNPERLRWLTWAKASGARLLSKPMWIKWKTLKSSKNCNGLVGLHKLDIAGWKMIENLRPVAANHLPPGFNLKFLENVAGAYPRPPKVYQVTKNFRVEGIEDGERLLSHYLVDMGDSFILVDAKGAAYIGDIDIVSIQRRLANGNFGPPGFNVGPAGQAAYKGGSDSAELESFFNAFFKNVGYPPGYSVFQHGGKTGTAGYFSPKKLRENFDLLGSASKPGWSPGKDWDSEKLLVAVRGVSEIEGVGFAKSWEALKAFHNANPMGEFRFSK